MSKQLEAKYHVNDRGMHWLLAAFFVIGDIAGGGLIVLPGALKYTGLLGGIILFFVMMCIASYTATLLGENWVILQKKWPEYRTHCRKPYPEMGYRGLGSVMRKIVSYSVNFTQFSVAVVYLLLSAKIIQDSTLLMTGFYISFCCMIIVVATLLLPVTMLKSPQDFWHVVVAAMFSTGVSCLFIIFGISTDSNVCMNYAEYSPISVGSVVIGMGTFFFSYDGHAAFPTIQHDMKEPHKFGRSVFLAYIIVTLVYMPVSILGYITYGSSIGESIIDSIQTPWMQMAANTLIAVHCILTLVFVLNPLNQEAEEYFSLPHSFGPERVFCRTVMMILVVFVAESVPTFGPLVNLVGGSTITLTAIVFPCLFNVYLKAQEHQAEDRVPTLIKVVSRTPKPKLLLITTIIVFGVVAGTAATYSAIKDLSTTHFAMPCYISPFFGSTEATAVSAIKCCGPSLNISSLGTPKVCFA
ncbi:hypothetical protein L596_002068 [Steinernema carpocapsae]|uniref:Amino acid transporter transmembrane domain-containing protein n=1 Tax=Steinernema carpocapsae TaxID=34508 RepID=A0A4U8UNG9_STECR|nr:hypothetical protein L596_002068 [Steinernema carpocapsae]